MPARLKNFFLIIRIAFAPEIKKPELDLPSDETSFSFAKHGFKRLFFLIIKKLLVGMGLEPFGLKIEDYFITNKGLLVFFHLQQNAEIRVYAQLFKISNFTHFLWKKPKLITTVGSVDDDWHFKSLVKFKDEYLARWYSSVWGDQQIKYATCLVNNEIELKQRPLLLEKPSTNPILKPDNNNSWEAFCTFNPAAVYAADRVHLLYRAQGYDYVSQIGYARSEDGLAIDERLTKPIYQPTQSFEGVAMPPGNPYGEYVSGGGCGGCEDPRATIIDDRLYMTYVAYDGWNPPRIALTSIVLTDFLKQKFLWKKPVLISPPGVVDKSAVIFPEKIKNKYVIMHRIFPNILLDFVDDLNFDGKTYLKGKYKISPRSRKWWDSRKVGAGAPPLKTKDGWLLIYQAVDDKDDSQYKVGAMLLDLDDPTKVLYRSSQPILQPSEKYENHGFKAGVVYPCGAVIKDKTLFVYYGGADSYVCVATAPLQDFLNNLKATGLNQLEPVMLGIT